MSVTAGPTDRLASGGTRDLEEPQCAPPSCTPSGRASNVRDDVSLVAVGAGQVRVRLHATGVCHSDLSAMTGTLPMPTPLVLGHEGAGEVVELGAGVTGLQVGDHVVVAWVPPCGHCRACLRGEAYLCQERPAEAARRANFRLGDEPIYGFMGTGTFAEEAVLPSEAVIPIPADVPFDVAAIVGCGVTTGVGAVLNTAKARPGDRIAVIGCGGVGIAAIQGAVLAGASVVLAVDPVEAKHEWARRFGATHAVVPDDLGEARRELTAGEGFDHVIEAVGRSATIRQAWDATRRGGTTVVVGAGATTDLVELSAFELFFMGRTLVGSVYGSADVRREFPRLLELWRAGRLELEEMITEHRTLDEADAAFTAMQEGRVIRQVIRF